MIVFLSCVKTKADRQCKAEDMYISDLFKKSLEYAKSLKPKAIYILSAKYGVLELNDIITPYEVTLNSMNEKQRKIWAYKVIQQCIEKNINLQEKAIFLCGTNYRKYVMTKFPNAEAPLQKLSIGKQLQFLKNNTK